MKELNSFERTDYLECEIVYLLVLLHAYHIVFGDVSCRANESEPIAVLGVGSINIKQRHLSRTQNLDSEKFRKPIDK